MPLTLLGTSPPCLLDLFRLDLDGFIVDKDTLTLISVIVGHARSASTTPIFIHIKYRVTHGSGTLHFLSFAAKSFTTSLSFPSNNILVGAGVLALTPSGTVSSTR